VLGKHNLATFKTMKAWKSKTQFKLVHSDLCTMDRPSLMGAKYLLTFVDEFSRYTWVYLLKNEDYVFENFKKFRILAEKKCGQPIKCLRSENGREYVSETFERYLP
jgi:hypothetical protein